MMIKAFCLRNKQKFAKNGLKTSVALGINVRLLMDKVKFRRKLMCLLNIKYQSAAHFTQRMYVCMVLDVNLHT